MTLPGFSIRFITALVIGGLSIIVFLQNGWLYSQADASTNLGGRIVQEKDYLIQQSSTLTQGLVAFYPFNGNANDSSGNNNNGTVYGATITTDRLGQMNQAYYFDGSNDYIRVPDSNSLDLTTAATFSIWARVADDINYNVYGSPHLFSKGATYGVLWADYGFLIEPTQSYFELTNDANSYQRATFPLIPETQWIHLIIVFQNGTATLYLNGVQVTQPATTHSLIRASTQPLYIGHRYATVNAGRFKGELDDFRIYNRALSSAEIQELYALEKVPEYVYLPFVIKN